MFALVVFMSRMIFNFLIGIAVAASPVCRAAELEEVIITASALGKNAETTQHPVNVLSGQALQNKAGATLGETLQGQPGVNSASFGPGVGLPVIRGQSDNRVKVMQNSLGSMDASAASPDHAIALEPLLATRIEVLRGPAALRYGGGAIGGVVNVLDNRIADTLPESATGGLELRASDGNDEVAQVARLDTALANMALHVDGLNRRNDDLNIPGYAVKNPEDVATANRGFVANTDAESRSGTLGLSYIAEQGFMGMSINSLNNNYGLPLSEEDPVRIDMHQTRYDIKGELREVNSLVEKILGRLGHNRYQHEELENAETGTRFSNKASDSLLEIVHRPFSGWQGEIGVQAAQSEFAALGDEAFIPTSKTGQTGIFVIEETRVGAWEYELGARLDKQTITLESSEEKRHHSDNLAGSVRWHFDEHQQLNISLAHSQRAPSVEELFANGAHPATHSYIIGQPNLKEESSRNAELGYHWHNGKVQASVNVFTNHLHNFIYAANTGEQEEALPVYQYEQVEAHFKGVEAEISFPVNSAIELRLFADYVRAMLENGEDLPRITPPRIGCSLTYEHSPWNGGLDFINTSRQRHPGVLEPGTDAYQRLDGHLNWSPNAGTLTFFTKVNNIFNREIRNASSYLRDISPEGGRNIQAGVRLEF